MAKQMARRIGLGLATAALLGAQSANVAGPSAGLVFEKAGRTLRPVMGIPGSALIGDPIKLEFEAAAVHMAPRQDAAIAVAADGSLRYLRIRSGQVEQRPLEGYTAKLERVAFSPGGTSAALISEGRATVLTGIPDNPALGASLDLEGAESVAISDDARYLLATGKGAVRLLGIGSGENLKLMDVGEGAIAAFAPGNHDAAVADAGIGLALFRNVAGGVEPAIIAAPDESAIFSPVGLAFASDGGKLFLASAEAKAVTAFNLKNGERGSFACKCTPAGLVRMGSAFRLNDLGTDPLWVLDAATDEPRIVFVPALRSE